MIESDGYLLSEVKKHDKIEDAWVTMDGQVYDVTTFLQGHPGGMDILIEHLGSDIQEAFLDNDHSEAAFKMLQRYQIGTLKGYRKAPGSLSTIEQIREKKKAIKEKKDKQDNNKKEDIYNGKNGANIQSGIVKDKNGNEIKIDVTKAMVPQLKLLEGDTYLQWIHSQIGLEEIIIFDKAFLEKFTRWPWWYIFILWVPIITGTFTYSLMQPNSSLLKSSITFIIGLFSWSLIEYILHRFVFHIQTSSYWGNFFHFFIHGIHHLTPYDSTRLTFPPMFSILLCYGAFKLFYSLPIGQENGLSWALYGGIACGYMLYDTVHYYFHHGEISWLPPIFKKMKTNHLNHHYKDDSKNYGVTSPIFDYVFGTI